MSIEVIYVYISINIFTVYKFLNLKCEKNRRLPSKVYFFTFIV